LKARVGGENWGTTVGSIFSPGLVGDRCSYCRDGEGGGALNSLKTIIPARREKYHDLQKNRNRAGSEEREARLHLASNDPPNHGARRDWLLASLQGSLCKGKHWHILLRKRANNSIYFKGGKEGTKELNTLSPLRTELIVINVGSLEYISYQGLGT